MNAVAKKEVTIKCLTKVTVAKRERETNPTHHLGHFQNNSKCE